MTPEEKIKELGYELKPIQVGGDKPLVPWVRTGNLLYLSGATPNQSGKDWKGQLGKEFTADQGYEAAQEIAMAHLNTLKTALGDLSKVKKVVKVLGMVNTSTGFSEQPKVINGYSEFLVKVFGENGRHARSAVGMGGLPGNAAVEIEAIFEVE